MLFQESFIIFSVIDLYTIEFEGKKKVEDFTEEEHAEALKKEYDNLINTGTIELVPYDQIKHIPKSKIITSHSFPIVKDDNSESTDKTGYRTNPTLATPNLDTLCCIFAIFRCRLPIFLSTNNT